MKKCCMCKIDLDTCMFKANLRKPDGLQSQCIECQREYRKAHYSKHKKKYLAKAKVWRDAFREWWQNFKVGMACSVCGESHPATLDFHHTDPSQKEDSVSALVTAQNKEKLLSEIEKCLVLCSNCHRKLHYDERN